MTLLAREESLDSGSSVFSGNNNRTPTQSPSRTPSPSPDHSYHPQTAPDSVLHLLEPTPVHPPEYSSLPPGGCPRFPILDDPSALAQMQMPPSYAPSVYKFDLVNRKLEWLSPYDPSPSRSWKTVLIELNSTQLNVYLIPSSVEAHLVLFKLNAINTRSGSFLYLPSPSQSRANSSVFSATNNMGSSKNGASQAFSKNYQSYLTSDFDRKFHEYVNSLVRPGSSFRDTFKLVRSYSLQHCKIGLAADYSKRRHVLRLRIENEQILLQWYDTPDLVEWNCALNVGKDLSLDLNSREIPRYRTVPRRRRSQRRNTTGDNAAGSNSNSHSSRLHFQGRPRRATESDASAVIDYEDDEALTSEGYDEGRPSSRNQILADEYEPYESPSTTPGAHDPVAAAKILEEFELLGYHKPYKPLPASITRSVSKLKIWKRRTSSQTSPMGSNTSLDSLAANVPIAGSSTSLSNYSSSLTARLTMTSLPNSPGLSPAPVFSGTPMSSGSLSQAYRTRGIGRLSLSGANAGSSRSTPRPSTNGSADSDDEYDLYDMDDEDEDEDDSGIIVGEDEELIRQDTAGATILNVQDEDDDEDDAITVNPTSNIGRLHGAPVTATGVFTKWKPDAYPTNEYKHFKNCLRCIKPLLFDDSWLNKPLLKPTSISTCSYTYIRWKHEVASLEDSPVKDKNDKDKRRLFAQMIIGDSSTLCKVPNHHLKEYVVGSHGLIPREVTFTI